MDSMAVVFGGFFQPLVHLLHVLLHETHVTENFTDDPCVLDDVGVV